MDIFDSEPIDLSEFEPIPAPMYALSLFALTVGTVTKVQGEIVEVETRLPEMEVVQYGKVDEERVPVYHSGTTLHFTREGFRKLYLELPPPQHDLRYCSFDEFFGMEHGEFWVYDLNTDILIDAKTLIKDKERHWASEDALDLAYHEGNYGTDWIAMIEDN